MEMENLSVSTKLGGNWKQQKSERKWKSRMGTLTIGAPFDAMANLMR